MFVIRVEDSFERKSRLETSMVVIYNLIYERRERRNRDSAPSTTIKLNICGKYHRTGVSQLGKPLKYARIIGIVYSFVFAHTHTHTHTKTPATCVCVCVYIKNTNVDNWPPRERSTPVRPCIIRRSRGKKQETRVAQENSISKPLSQHARRIYSKKKQESVEKKNGRLLFFVSSSPSSSYLSHLKF